MITGLAARIDCAFLFVLEKFDKLGDRSLFDAEAFLA
jgi:hypothetical protein